MEKDLTETLMCEYSLKHVGQLCLCSSERTLYVSVAASSLHQTNRDFLSASRRRPFQKSACEGPSSALLLSESVEKFKMFMK